MTLEDKVGVLDEAKVVCKKESVKPSRNYLEEGDIKPQVYKGPQIALAQHSVDYCGDGMGDGCKND